MKTLLLAVASILMMAAPALAQGGVKGATGGGFTGPGPGLDTVAQALTYRDDTTVMLQGNIVRHLGSDKYLFEDQTGTITVDIDNRKWEGQNVTPQSKVEIHGEIDKDWSSIEVDVDSIKVL
ncbi:MAG: YgiW/YdeI family stress tolerance OB fold protein [Deltaproteobacteria bacterium]|nr:YgiW/YdeI family stress tolerance OB fold protein [Deltaproteobacteria bacterium]